MTAKEMEARVAALEKAVAKLQERSEAANNPWAKIIGHFKDDPIYDEIVRLGKEYRDSQHPDRRKKKAPRKP